MTFYDIFLCHIFSVFASHPSHRSLKTFRKASLTNQNQSSFKTLAVENQEQFQQHTVINPKVILTTQHFMDTKHYYLFSFLTLANSCVILLVNIYIDAGFHDTVLNARTFIDSLVFFLRRLSLIQFSRVRTMSSSFVASLSHLRALCRFTTWQQIEAGSRGRRQIYGSALQNGAANSRSAHSRYYILH